MNDQHNTEPANASDTKKDDASRRQAIHRLAGLAAAAPMAALLFKPGAAKAS